MNKFKQCIFTNNNKNNTNTFKKKNKDKTKQKKTTKNDSNTYTLYKILQHSYINIVINRDRRRSRIILTQDKSDGTKQTHTPHTLKKTLNALQFSICIKIKSLQILTMT